MSPSRIGITLGDPGGIGPEVVFKGLRMLSEYKAIDPVLFGPETLFKHPYIQHLAQGLSYEICCVEDSGSHPLVIGKPDSQNGRMALRSIQQAVDAIHRGDISALVTAPICKESLFLAGSPWTDHTTLLAHLTGSQQVSMGFDTPRLKTVLLTVHVPYLEVPGLITLERCRIAARHALYLAGLNGIQRPRIAIPGLNPHAGESGLFGTFEEAILKPILAQLLKENIPIEGPFPADTLYFRASQGEFDVVLSLFHDQGLIPIKLLGFHEAVNVTLGLPFIRTSPDHGTAFDIAYQDKADPRSCTQALQKAMEWSEIF